MTDHLLIGGDLVPGDGPRFDVIDPSSGNTHTARHVHWNLELVPKPWWYREE